MEKMKSDEGEYDDQDGVKSYHSSQDDNEQKDNDDEKDKDESDEGEPVEQNVSVCIGYR